MKDLTKQIRTQIQNGNLRYVIGVFYTREIEGNPSARKIEKKDIIYFWIYFVICSI